MFGLSLGSLKWIAAGLAALFIAGIIFAGYRYIENRNAELEAALQNVAALKTAKAVQDDTIKQLSGALTDYAVAAKKNQEALAKIAEGEAARQASIDKLAATFQKHDLGKLTHAKPTLIQALINRGTAAALDGLRAASIPHGHDQGSGHPEGQAGAPATAGTAPAPVQP